MSFRDTLLTVLSGGLPALLDDPTALGGSAGVGGGEGSPITPIRVEEAPPTGTFRDRESFFMGITQNQILIGTAAIIGGLVLVMVVRR